MLCLKNQPSNSRTVRTSHTAVLWLDAHTTGISSLPTVLVYKKFSVRPIFFLASESLYLAIRELTIMSQNLGAGPHDKVIFHVS